MIKRLLVFVTLGLCASLTQSVYAQSTSHQSSQYKFNAVTFASGLENVWGMDFLPSGDMLVTERPGRLRIIRNGILLKDSVPGIPEVNARGQGGLLDVALHPNFATNHLIYFSYSKPR